MKLYQAAWDRVTADAAAAYGRADIGMDYYSFRQLFNVKGSSTFRVPHKTFFLLGIDQKFTEKGTLLAL